MFVKIDTGDSTRMNIRLLMFLIALFSFSSCVVDMEIGDEAPEWTFEPPKDSESHRTIRGQAAAENIAAAELAAFDDLKSALIEKMELGPVEYWSDEDISEFEVLFGEIIHTIKTAKPSNFGVKLGAKGAWKDTGSRIHYAVEINWDKQAFADQATRLFELIGTTNPWLHNYILRARAAMEENAIYEAALLRAAVAGISKLAGIEAGYRIALEEVERSLDSLEISLIGVPDRVFVGLRPALPVVFSVKSRGRPVANAEFIITYPHRARDGSIYNAEARVFSDTEGSISFRPPEVVLSGPQEISIALSAAPFLDFLGEEKDASVQEFETRLEKVLAIAVYDAQVRIRFIPMGILILETDLVGNVLGETDAAEGLFSDLIADGFNAAIIEMNPSEVLPLSERALLRNLKADARFSDRYERVIHGRVALESFEQVGDAYTVRVSGFLAMSDIQKQVTLLRSQFAKTSQGAVSQQAISAAFRQFGRSFAEEIIELAP